MNRLMSPMLVFLVGSFSFGPADAAPADRFNLSKPIELKAGDEAGALAITEGRIRLFDGSRAGALRIDNGEARLDVGSRSGSVWIGVGDGVIAGEVDGDVYCGTGTLKIESTALVSGQLLSLDCAVDIEGGARIGGDVVSFGQIVRLGPELELPGRLVMLPGLGERKARDLPTLDLRARTAVAGGVWLDHCVQLERGRNVSATFRGVVPHEPVGTGRQDRAPCSRMPDDLGQVPLAELSVPSDVYAFGRPDTHPGESLGDIRLVNAGMEVATSVQAGAIRTHNGAVVLAVGASAKSVSVINGAVVLKPDARIAGDLKIGNGPLVMERGSRIGGDVRVVTSSIELAQGAHIDGRVTQYGNEVVIAKGATIQTLHFALTDDADPDSRAELKLDSAAALTGELVLDRPVRIKLNEGPAPRWSGVEPDIRIRGKR